MTLRVILQIVPFGDEEKAYEIERLNISNEGRVDFDTDECSYIIEQNNYKNYNRDTPRVLHRRKNGALTLVKKALEKLGQ